MNNRNRRTILLLFFSTLITPLFGLPTVWSSAVELYRDNANWSAGSVLIKMDELDRRGEVKSTQEMLMRNTLDANGEIQTETVYVIKDGEDITGQPSQGGRPEGTDEEDEGSENSQAMRRLFSFPPQSPFDPELQDIVIVENTTNQQRINRQLCNEYNYRIDYPDTDKDLFGTVWLSVDKGIPLKMEYTMDNFPFYISDMVITVFYEWEEGEYWYPGEYSVVGGGGFLFIKKYYSTTSVLSDYYRIN